MIYLCLDKYIVSHPELTCSRLLPDTIEKPVYGCRLFFSKLVPSYRFLFKTGLLKIVYSLRKKNRRLVHYFYPSAKWRFVLLVWWICVVKDALAHAPIFNCKEFPTNSLIQGVHCEVFRKICNFCKEWTSKYVWLNWYYILYITVSYLYKNRFRVEDSEQ